MEKKQEYLFVPIMLLRDLITQPKDTLDDILVSGIYGRSKTLEFNFDGDEEREERYLLSQFAYAYANERDTMPESLICEFKDLDDFDFFNHKGFKHKEAVEKIYDILDDNDSNDEIKDGAIAFSRIRESLRRYELTDYLNSKDVNLSIDYILERGKELNDSTPLKMPMVMIKTDKAIEFRDNPKTERELVKFAVYLSMCSILGKKAFGFTNRQMIFARAFGFKDMNELKLTPPDKYNEYKGVKKQKNILEEVETEWYMFFGSGNGRDGIRGTYIGDAVKMNEDKFMDGIETAQSKRKDRRNEKNRKREEAKRRHDNKAK